MSKSFKQRLASGETVRTFALARMVNPMVIDLFGLVGGYDGFWLDQEHAGVSYDQVAVAAVAARANGFDCFVRIPPVGYWQVTQSLEAGAGGVMAAQIQSFEQARQFVSWTKFAPLGTRGLNTSGRDANYTHKLPAQFAEEANRDQFVAIQIETLGALDDVERIAALEGVDLLFIGPSDLSLALGVVGQFHHPKLWEALERVSAACQRHGKAWGAVLPDPKFAARALELGCRMPSVGNDVLAMRFGIETMRKNFGF